MTNITKNLIKYFSILFLFLLIILCILVLLDVNINFYDVKRFTLALLVSASFSGYMAKLYYTLLSPNDQTMELDLTMNKAKYLAIVQLIFIYFLITGIILLLEYIDIYNILQKLLINKVECSGVTPPDNSSSSTSGSSSNNVIGAAVAGATFTTVFAALPKSMPVIPKTITSACLAGGSAACGEGAFKLGTAFIDQTAQAAISTGTEMIKSSPHADPNPQRVPSPSINDTVDSFPTLLPPLFLPLDRKRGREEGKACSRRS